MFAIMKSKKIKPKKMKEVKEVIYSDPQDFDIKAIDVDLVFADGGKFRVAIYGAFYQYVNPSDYHVGPNVAPVSLITAMQAAQQFIQCMDGLRTYVNDTKNPSVSVTGQVVSAHIDTLSGERSYIEKYAVASVITKQVEDV